MGGGTGTTERTGSVWLKSEICFRGPGNDLFGFFFSLGSPGQESPRTKRLSLFQTVPSVEEIPARRPVLGGRWLFCACSERV